MRDGADEDLGAWLRLLGTPGIGRERARRLLAALGSPQAVFSAEREARVAVAGAAAAALDEAPAGHDRQLDATRAWLTGGPSRGWITLGDALYPRQLLASPDPPLLLYLEGRAELLASARALAIVGSRHPTAQGRDHARQFARELAGQGWVVVSGLAMGIDGEAHEGALEAGSAGGAGSTIAVVGTGPDVVYPARHRALHAQLVARGLVISECPVGTPPVRENFPRRNRIIAGLTRGTLVVEAALQSGSLITARLASEAGREVFAIPGSILSPQSRGCHALIRQGAKLVECVADVLEEFDAPAAAMSTGLPHADLDQMVAPVDEGDEGDPLLAALGLAPTSLDALQARTGWPTAELNAKLLELELEDQVARLPGGLFQRRRSA